MKNIENNEIEESLLKNRKMKKTNETNHKTEKNNLSFIKNIMLAIFLLSLIPASFATLKLDDIQFDPAIIAAGDMVDIIVQYHDEFSSDNNIREGNPEYSFRVWLEAADSVSNKYLTFFDSEGDDDGRIIFGGKYYNKVFRVKVNQNAPSGEYKLKVIGKWYKNGVPEDANTSIDFFMPVKKEGVVINIGNIITTPAKIRPGDNYVKIETEITNSGEKDSKNIEIKMLLPEGFENSYSTNQRQWIGSLKNGETKTSTFFIDIDNNLTNGEYQITYEINYEDDDENKYYKEIITPFLVKEKPEIVILESKGTLKKGAKGDIEVTLKNIGEESAEAVDVRVILQNSQPFTIDVRNDYIGELKPGEVGTAIFALKANSDATEKTHDLKLLIRAKGDSDEGDDQIYTFNRRATFDVKGKSTNWFFYGGVVVLILVLIIGAIKLTGGKNEKR